MNGNDLHNGIAPPKKDGLMSLRDTPDFEDQWTKISQQELDEILDRHEAFADGRQGGERAKLGMYDMSYLDFTGRQLSGIEMTGALLCHCDLSNADLSDANLFGADMRFAYAVGACMDRADLRGACLAGADLSNISIVEGDLRDGVLLKSAGKGGDLVPVVHDDATAGMEKATIRGADVRGANFNNTDTRGCKGLVKPDYY